ncbi:MAG: putative motility protein [Lachnospiraceae bacterium]|nr:putative motility protein [Lachnospiraceae bacterium]MCR5083754.1 YjfB family protein [Parasporobacterium sp.]
MEIGELSTALAMTDVGNQVAVAVLDNSLDTVEALGDGMVKMMEQSVMPHLGGNIDYSV